MLKRVWDNLQMALRPAWQAEEVGRLYGAAATQARLQVFYQTGGVPDSIDGRFDLLSLHLVMLMRRLRGHGGGNAMQQALFDLLAADMDRNLREMGVGDTGISRRVKTMGEGFFGRYKAYDAALTAPAGEQEAALMTALDKNLYGTVPTDAAGLRRMAGYVLAMNAALQAQSLDALLSGNVTFNAFGDDDAG